MPRNMIGLNDRKQLAISVKPYEMAPYTHLVLASMPFREKMLLSLKLHQRMPVAASVGQQCRP